VHGAAIIVTRSLCSVTLLLFKFQFIELMILSHLSCFGKKGAQRSRPKGRYAQMRPLRYPLPHRHPAFKNVPIFERFHGANL